MNISFFIERFFFQKIPARGFHLLVVAWALVTLGTLLLQWTDVDWFYSGDSFLPLSPDVFSIHAFPRFSLFHYITDPRLVFAIYIILLFALLAVLIGVRTREALILSILLLHSFHHRNPLPMGGGDVMLFNIGFLLMVTPGIGHSSLVTRWFTYRRGARDETTSDDQMPIWPYRLLLWQVILVYLSSLWWKLLGTTWIDGTAIAIAFQNPHFARFDLPIELINALSPLMGYSTMVWEFLWVLLLIPPFAFQASGGRPNFKYHELTKRILIIAGIFFHLGILIFLRVGSFSLAMLLAYIGLGARTCPPQRTVRADA